MSFNVKKPEPGVYDGLPIQTYFDAPGVSRSTLMRLEDGTPKDLRHYMDHGIQETDAMRLGSAVDMLVFEPELWTTEAAVRPAFGRSKADQTAKAEWEDANAGRLQVTESQYELACRMAEAVQSAKAVRGLMDGATAQRSLWWREDDGLYKTRPDAVNEGKGWTFDLKTTHSLKDRDLATKVVDYGYEVQAAMACSATKAAGLDWRAHVIVWVSKTDPIDVRCTTIEYGDNWHLLGEARFLRLARAYQTAMKERTWEGHSSDLQPLPMPKWVGHKLADEQQLNEAQMRRMVTL